MDFLPKVTCRRCHREYSTLRSRCPQCGAKKVRAGDRAAPAAGSPDAAENMRWQFIFGLIIVSIVILAVGALILIGIGGDPVETPPPSTEIPITTETPRPTPTPTPIPEVTGIDITYLGNKTNGFTLVLANPTLNLGATVYPLTTTARPTWSSSNSSVLSVTPIAGTNNCTVTAVSVGTAELTVSCGDRSEKIMVIVRENW